MTNTRNEGSLIYVYCAVRGTLQTRVVAKLPSMPEAVAPRVLPLTDAISLVVADVPAATYRSEAVEARLSDLDWVAHCGSAHHAVADALVPKHTVVPFRLFTLFSTEARARETLGAEASRIDEALDRVQGKAEWVLRIGKPDPALAQRSSSKTVEPTSGTSFLAQKAAAKRAASELAARVRHDAAALYDALSQVADKADKRPEDSSTGLLLDAAFLVPVRQVAVFKRVLEAEATQLLQDGCRVSLTGPWPPYSFASLGSESKRG